MTTIMITTICILSIFILLYRYVNKHLLIEVKCYENKIKYLERKNTYLLEQMEENNLDIEYVLSKNEYLEIQKDYEDNFIITSHKEPIDNIILGSRNIIGNRNKNNIIK